MVWIAVLLGVVVLAFWLCRIGERNNKTDWGSRRLNRLEGLNRVFCRRFHRMQADAIALPEKGGAVLVANHVSGLDPVAMIAASPRPLRWMIAQEEYNRFGLRTLFSSLGCIPVDRKGRPEVALREAIRALRNGEVVAVFPQGAITPTGTSTKPLKRGAVFMAERAGVPIVPLRIEGVRAEGMTIAAVFVRSHLRLVAGSPVDETLESDAKLEAIARFITPDLPGA